MTQLAYVGEELGLFAAAARWKGYVRRQLEAFLRGDVLEVGAGQGATTAALCGPGVRSWTCLEPDPDMAAVLRTAAAEGQLPPVCEAVCGTTEDLAAQRTFDAVLYADVLEHIDDDRAELGRAAGLLRPGGRLVVLAPAMPWLFSPFDRAIGHRRRYTKGTLAAATPAGLRLVRMRYLDSAGMLASAANRWLLRRPMPGAGQLAVWDRLLVPISRISDRLLGYALGKSVLGVWEKD